MLTTPVSGGFAQAAPWVHTEQKPVRGAAYVVVGAICLSLALAFFIKDRISPRDFAGNPSGNKKGGDDK